MTEVRGVLAGVLVIGAIGALLLAGGIACCRRLKALPDAAALGGGLAWLGATLLVSVAGAGVGLLSWRWDVAELATIPGVMMLLGCFFTWPVLLLGLSGVTRDLLALIEENRDLAAQLREARRQEDAAP